MNVECPRCGKPLEAADEDDLVEKVRSHVRDDHGLARDLPRKHILAMLGRQHDGSPPAGTNAGEF